MERYSVIEQREYSPAVHWYGVTQDGDKHHLKTEDVMAYVSHIERPMDQGLLAAMERFERLERKVFSPAKHVWGKDANTQKWQHLSHAGILEYYGYPPSREEYESQHQPPKQDDPPARDVAAIEAQDNKRARVKRAAFALGAAALGMAKRHPERTVGVSRRRKAAVAVAGAVAIATAVFLSPSPSGPGDVPGGAHVAHHHVVPRDTHRPKPVARKEAPSHSSVPSEYNLAQYNAQTGAGTVWSTDQTYARLLGYKHLSGPQLWNLTAATLRLNDVSWSQARQLKRGFPVRMISPNAARQLLG